MGLEQHESEENDGRIFSLVISVYFDSSGYLMVPLMVLLVLLWKEYLGKKTMSLPDNDKKNKTVLTFFFFLF